MLTSVAVTPASVTVASGASMQFTAAGVDQLGKPIAITPSWSSTGGAIDAAGRYTAPASAGQFTVTATAQGIAGRATVTVQPTAPPNNPPPSNPGTTFLELDGRDDHVEIAPASMLDLTGDEPRVGAGRLAAWS